MQSLVESFTLMGIEAVPVEVQVSVTSGYPTTTIVGLPDKAVRESLDRVFAAFHSSGFGRPKDRVTVNLAPAELRKEGSSFDLAIALGILGAQEAFPAGALDGLPVAGELALDGEIRPVRGALAMALATNDLKRKTLLLPQGNLAEASDVGEVSVFPLQTLKDTVRLLNEERWDPATLPARCSAQFGSNLFLSNPSDGSDLAQVRGQRAAKRALEVTAAGGHNLLMVGPPGAGKTLLAQRIPGILPPLTAAEALEVTLIHSVAGLLKAGTGRIRVRPFRAPHHTVTGPGLIGGGAIPKPGEVSLAHAGVLFLDEMPEFRPPVLNLMRQPLEEGWVRLVRSGRTVAFPSRFMLIGAMNPCPCGFLGHPRKPCKCTPHQVRLYKNRISGPLLDRMDLHIEVPALTARQIMRGMGTAKRQLELGSPEDASDPAGQEGSAAVRSRVVAARQVQQRRFQDRKTPNGASQRSRFDFRQSVLCNAQMGIPEIEEFCRIDDATGAFLQKAVESLSLSARATHRALRVARTIADLAGAEAITLEHVAEAVQYQAFDRSSDGVRR